MLWKECRRAEEGRNHVTLLVGQPAASEATNFLSCLSPLALDPAGPRLSCPPELTTKGEEITEKKSYLRKRKSFSKLGFQAARDQSNEKVPGLFCVFP